MKKVLLVDDDPLVIRIYAEGLAKRGFQIESAGDGLEAVKALRTGSKPDLVVLDLMMPKFSGSDVLKFIRSQKDLAKLPVVVLSNAYMGDLAREAVALGVEKALLKVRCSPPILAGVISDILAGKTSAEDFAQWPTIPDAEPLIPHSGPPAPSAAPMAHAAAASPAGEEAAAQGPSGREDGAHGVTRPTDGTELRAKTHRDFLEHASATSAALRSLCQALTNSRTETQRDFCLQNLYRKVHFITATAGLAGSHYIAQMASAFEALLFEIMGNPVLMSPSVQRTIVVTTDFFGLLFERVREPFTEVPPTTRTLVVDDDPISNRLVVSALRNVQLEARSTEDPMAALQWLQQTKYDLVLLDIEMPKLDGFEFCKRMRTFPGHRETPVIYVTVHTDFESRAKGVLSGGDDLIAKPVFPIELAVKATMHLLKRHLTETQRPAENG